MIEPRNIAIDWRLIEELRQQGDVFTGDPFNVPWLFRGWLRCSPHRDYFAMVDAPARPLLTKYDAIKEAVTQPIKTLSLHRRRFYAHASFKHAPHVFDLFIGQSERNGTVHWFAVQTPEFGARRMPDLLIPT